MTLVDTVDPHWQEGAWEGWACCCQWEQGAPPQPSAPHPTVQAKADKAVDLSATIPITPGPRWVALVLTILNWTPLAPLLSVIPGATSQRVLSMLFSAQLASWVLPDRLCDVNQPA